MGLSGVEVTGKVSTDDNLIPRALTNPPDRDAYPSRPGGETESG